MKYLLLPFFVVSVTISYAQNVQKNEDSLIVLYQCPAEFIGGHQEMLKYLMSNFDYSMIDYDQFGFGKMYITFVVEQDGSVTEQMITNREGQNILFEDKVPFPNMPKWKPACDENGSPIKELIRIPINIDPK